MGLRIVQEVKDINHAQFVDDTLLLGGASIHHFNTSSIMLVEWKKTFGDKNQEACGSKLGIRTLATFTNKQRPKRNLTLSRKFNIKIKQSRILKESSRLPTPISKVYI